MTKDYKNHYSGIRQSPTVTTSQVPNSVSRDLSFGETAFQGVVVQTGKPLLDVDFNHQEQIQREAVRALSRWDSPSGWLKTSSRKVPQWVFDAAPVGVSDDSGSSLIHADRTLVNALLLPRIEALVAGHHVIAEYTNTSTSGYNLIPLTEPTIYDGTSGTVKRTDFVFLEVWKALVAPSPRASAEVQVVAVADLNAGDVITLNGTDLTAVAGASGVDEFTIGGSEEATSTNIATAINAGANSFTAIATAREAGHTVLLYAVDPGEGEAIPLTGNFTTLSVTVATAGALVASAGTFTGGEDRPNKPNQAKIYRQGNTQSPEDTWLDDEIIDPLVAIESTQRIQLQYRFRVTSSDEAINYKKHPDGFSSPVSGSSDPAIFARGGRAIPVWSGNGTDSQSYPFVPANKTSTWLDSSAQALGFEDNGLWVAGDGSQLAAQDLGSLDGFVYAIPIAMIHRHNNSSNVLAGAKGFDPDSNTNGAPEYDHAGFTGPLGAISAGLSDRPDGSFCDVVSEDRLVDLRRHISLGSPRDLSSELTYQLQSLLDGSLKTWSIDTSDKQTLGGGSGDVSTQPLVCNEIGRSTSVGGSSPLSGDGTGRGVLVRNYDHIARRFGDQAVVERVLISFWPGDRNGAPVGNGTNNSGKFVTKTGGAGHTDKWYEGDKLTLDLSELNATTLGGLFDARPGAGTGDGGSASGLGGENFTRFAPSGTVITDVLGAWHDDGHYDQLTSQETEFSVIKGLGTTLLELTLDANDTTTTEGLPIGGGNVEHKMVGSDVDGSEAVLAEDAGSPRRIFLEVEITYPHGAGTTDTVDLTLTPDATTYNGASLKLQGPGPVIENNTSQRPADYEALATPNFRLGFREIQTEYVANDTIQHSSPLGGSAIGSVTPETIVSSTATMLRFPRRVWSSTGLSVTDAETSSVRTIDSPACHFGASTREVHLSNALSGSGHTLCNVQYFAQDPIPNYGVSGGGWQLSYYYRSTAPQTAGVKEGDITSTGDGVLPTELVLEPLCVSEKVWTSHMGSGSPERPFPYLNPLDALPTLDGSTTTSEWYFCGTSTIALDSFSANTGLLSLPTYMPQDMSENLILGGAGASEKPTKDAEFRAMYPFADDSTYRPTVFGDTLYGPSRHKVFTPFLARVVEESSGTSDGLLWRKGEVVLVVLSRFASLDENNTIEFVDTDNRTCAAVYRTRNLVLTAGNGEQ